MHYMHLDSIFDGWECYGCEQCARAIRIRWKPDIVREVWAAGDETVTHTGGRRTWRYDHRFVEQLPPSSGLIPAGADPDVLLAPWLKLMRERGWAE